MALLWTKLGDDFDRHDGALSDYTLNTLTNSLTPQRHYDLRRFDDSDVTGSWTMGDMQIWNTYHFDGFLMSTFDNPHSLNPSKENWTADPDITLVRNASQRYVNEMQVNLDTLVGTKQTDSVVTVADDILTDFSDATVYISFIIKDSSVLDLANSSVSFSSSPTFAGGQTTTLVLDNYDISIGGADILIQIPRADLLPNVTLSNLKAVRLTLTPSGTGIIRLQEMRVHPSTYVSEEIEPNTRRNYLSRSVQLDGTEPGTTFGILFYKEARPKNLTTVTKFYSGHRPTSNSTWNILRQYFRYQDADNHIRVDLESGTNSGATAESRLRIYERVGGVTSELFSTTTGINSLTNDTYYFLEVSVQGSYVKASIYEANGSQYKGDVVYETVTTVDDLQLGVKTQINNRGRAGYSFEPYNYDFFINYIQPSFADFATFQTASFPSVKSVAGVTLYRSDSGYIDLTEQSQMVAIGDATLTSNKVERTGLQWYGGVKLASSATVANSQNVVLTGAIFPYTARGEWRVVLMDEHEAVGLYLELDSPVANAWNDFSIAVTAKMLPAEWTLALSQAGFYDDSFLVRDLKVTYNTVSWEASSNDGVLYTPFFNVSDSPETELHFPTAHQGNKLRLRAIAQSDKAWIGERYVVDVYYRNPYGTLQISGGEGSGEGGPGA